MSIFNKKNKPVHDLHPIEDKQCQLEKTLTEITPLLVIIMIFILLVLASMKFGFAFSTEANHYENLEEIVLNCVGVLL